MEGFRFSGGPAAHPRLPVSKQHQTRYIYPGFVLSGQQKSTPRSVVRKTLWLYASGPDASSHLKPHWDCDASPRYVFPAVCGKHHPCVTVALSALSLSISVCAGKDYGAKIRNLLSSLKAPDGVAPGLLDASVTPSAAAIMDASQLAPASIRRQVTVLSSHFH